jgi:aldehyde dehydrogenase (NAD+)
MASARYCGNYFCIQFPVAVWCWNSALAWVAGDVCVWKPSEKVPLCSIACQKIVQQVFEKNKVPEGVSCIVNGDYTIGELLSHDTRIPLVSATGSTRMGKLVGAAVGARLGRSLLELGGNNAIIITANADLDATLVGRCVWCSGNLRTKMYFYQKIDYSRIDV